LKAPRYFDAAEELAKARGSPLNADDLIQAKIESIRTRKTGLPAILENLRVKREVVSSIVWSSEKLDYVRMVQKVSLTIPVAALASQWHLDGLQTSVVKLVVGPRYDVETDSFKLVRRNRAPFKEMLNEETVYDALVDKLVQVVTEVKNAVPPVYEFTEDVVSYRAHPRIPVQPVTAE